MLIDELKKRIYSLENVENVLCGSDLHIFTNFFHMMAVGPYEEILKRFVRIQVYDCYGRFGYNIPTYRSDAYVLDGVFVCIVITHENSFGGSSIYWDNKEQLFRTFEFFKEFEIDYINKDNVDYIDIEWEIETNILK